MYRRPRLLRQHGVPGHHQLLSDGGPAVDAQLAGDPALVHGVVLHHVRVLTVGENSEVLAVGQDQAVPHQVGILYRHPVVGQGHRARRLQGLKISEFLPLLSPGHCADGPDMDAAGLSRLLLNEVDPLRGIGDRPGVGHTGDRGKSSVGGCRRAGLNGLLILKAGLPQVHVHIHQAGTYRQAPGVNDLRVRLSDIAADDGYLAILQ